MSRSLRVLMLEDQETDALLLLRELRRLGYKPDSVRVETASDYAAALDAGSWDIVLADYNLPQYGINGALAELKKRHLAVPLVIVSGAVGEEAVVDALHQGACDYIAKDRLMRLGPVIERELLKAEDQRRLSQAQAQIAFQASLLDQVHNSVMATDRQGRIIYFNRSAALLFHRSQAQALSLTYRDFFPSGTLAALDQIYQSGGDIGSLLVEGQIERHDGSQFDAYMIANAHYDANNQFSGLVLVTIDISERTQAEERIKASLREKETLLQEIHHRVKNNLQIVSSLLKLQAGQIEDPPTRAMFAHSQERIRSMALIHESLYQSPDLSRINFPRYVKTLLTNLRRTYISRSQPVRLESRIDEVNLSMETALPCGLIINELVTNAFIHAFNGSEGGLVEVIFEQLPAGLPPEPGRILPAVPMNGLAVAGPKAYRLVVRDNGRGFIARPGTRLPGRPGSLGMTLIETLVQQLDGRLEVQSEAGSTFIVTFQELQYQPRV